MDLFEDLNTKFVMIHIIHKILALLKSHLTYLKDNVLECFFKKYKRLFFFLKKKVLFMTYNDEKSKA